jgi:chromate transporter
MVLGGARAFERLRTNPDAVAFLAGAGPAAIGAIFGTAVLMLGGLSHLWQVPLLALGSLWLLVARRSTVSALLTAAGIGALLGVAGLPSGF